MCFAVKKLKLNHLLVFLVISVYFSSAFAEQPLSKNPWFNDDQASSSARNLNFANRLNDEYLSQLATRGARWQLDNVKLKQLLTVDAGEFDLLIPMPDGSLQLFKLSPNNVMAAKLAAKYPQLRSFQGVQIGDKTNSGRFDYSPDGFSGMFRYNGQWVMLATNKQSAKIEYISYYAKDEIQHETPDFSGNDYLTSTSKNSQTLAAKAVDLVAQRAVGEQIRTLRLAVSASGEYTSKNGGKAGAMAEIVRLVNRVNQIFLVDLAIQFELVDENEQLIFTNPNTDPFTNTSALDDIDANQDIIDSLIGSSNYDIGHVLNTDPGGLATSPSACRESIKAKAQTGSSRPTGESFYIQLVIHEFGHQLGAAHTFNALDQNTCNSSQRSPSSAVEPGSGSTIMSYANLCGEQNLQQSSDGYFHAFSIEQIQRHLATRSCGTSQSSGNDIPFISTAPIRQTIPASTPFFLNAQVSDSDGDSLSYAWDQINTSGFEGATATRQERETDNGANPLFRSYPPRANSMRYFPRLTDIINSVDSAGEVLPVLARQIIFELVVRDGNGGVNTLQAEVNIEQTGEAFSVTQPLASTTISPVRWTGGQLQDVRWNTADTELAPISCASVDILLDADGNNTFETSLALATDNDGSQQVLSPNTNSTRARLMIKCSDSIFYAINPGQFELLPGADPVAPLITAQLNKTLPEDSSFPITFSDLIIDDPDTDYPENFTLRIEQGANYSFSDNNVTPQTNFNGTLSVNVSVNDGISDSNIFPFVAQIDPINDAPTAIDDEATIIQDASSTSIDVLINDLDPDQDALIVTEINYSGAGQAAIANNRVSYSPAAGFSGKETITYKIEDSSFATSTATLTITVSATPITPTPTAPTSGSSGGGSFGHLLILLTLGVLVSMSTACVQSSTLTSSQTNGLSIQTAQNDAKLAAQNLDFRVLGFVRKLISLPGIDQAEYSTQWLEKHCGIRILEGVTDTVVAGQDLSHQKALHIYAEAYNKVIFNSCQIFQKDYSE